jgi:hypothetical protein
VILLLESSIALKSLLVYSSGKNQKGQLQRKALFPAVCEAHRHKKENVHIMGIAAPTRLTVQSYTSETVQLAWYDGDTYDKVLVAWGPGNSASDPASNQVDVDAASATVAGFSENSFTIDGVDTASSKSYVFKVKGGQKSDIFGSGISWDYSDWDSIVWMAPGISSFGGSSSSVAPVIIYGVQPDGPQASGNLLWYLHLGAADGTDRWKTAAAPIATQWNFKQVFSGGKGVIYAVTQDGYLRWYRHLGAAQGTPGLITTSDHRGYIGEGWNFKQVFSGGDGIIYAVTDAGKLLWYRHLGFEDGSDKWLTTPDPQGLRRRRLELQAGVFRWQRDHLCRERRGKLALVSSPRLRGRQRQVAHDAGSQGLYRGRLELPRGVFG